jgi:multimeric flavodoxin WrbA
MKEMDMKVLGISASPRKNKSNTLVLLKQALAATEEKGFQTEVVHLCDLKIAFCRHCETCHKEIMDCPIKDDANRLIKKILESKGIIFASPVYIDHITGYLKTFFDRSTHFIHCLRLLGKYTAAVATSGGGPHEMVLEYLKYFSIICGAQYVGGVSTSVPVTEDIKKKAGKLGETLSEAIKSKKEFSDQMKEIQSRRSFFRRIIEAHKEEWAGEYDYWKEMGWL